MPSRKIAPSPDPGLPRPTLSIETLALLSGLWIAASCNHPFWQSIMDGRDWTSPDSWPLAVGALAALTGLHALLAGVLLTRRTARPVLALFILIAATASHFTESYGVYLDPGMIRNALETEPKEARDLLGFGLALHLLIVAGPATLLIAWVRIRDRQVGPMLAHRLGFVVGTALAVAAGLLAAYPDLAGPIRSHREIRYLVTPGNVLWSMARVAITEGREASKPRQPIALDARRSIPTAGARPLLLLIMLGETARAANWGLNGYARDTTPALRTRGVINFPRVTACGTDTAISVPCLFAPIGRRDYDEARIRNSESLLHVLARTGFSVSWRDNQTGCKGVCDGLPFETIDDGSNPDCTPGRCLDIHLLDGLEAAFDGRDRVMVLHMIGSHGPAYDRRYPEDHAVYQPVCGETDLGRCSRESIVNSYDNTIRYTDTVLAAAIDRLAAHSATHDVAMLYVSDHGESLGEHRLYLHGIPWRIAPAEQTQVPMVLWLSDGFVRRLGLDRTCLDRRAAAPVTHDHVFHTVLGMLEVTTRAYEASLDVITACRHSRTLARDP